MTARRSSISIRRLLAMCRKESYQIIRDPSNALIAIIIPLLLLFIFGYGINLDTGIQHIGIVAEQNGPATRNLITTFHDSPYLHITVSDHRQPLIAKMQRGAIRGIVIIPTDFDQLTTSGKIAPLQLITDGSEPNTAQFVQSYVQGVWRIWLQQRALQKGHTLQTMISTTTRVWFNPAAISRHFIIPGAISIIMTVIGTILTSLVIAREWENGTMEALLSTRLTRIELLLSKLLPYYLLGLLAMGICVVVATVVLDVPLRGSLLTLTLTTLLFLTCSMGIGLLISTVTKNQFNAAMIALNAAFLPAVMLSGFVFEIDSMPAIVRLASYMVPARYFVSILKTVFLAGNLGVLITINSLYLFASALLFIGLTYFKTPTRLEVR
ncbi:MAG: putative multidrug ABC transporter permease YbhS [Candidatus Celerinatantimonas neptuna]|nr:MAG: putative multidrug ABC transporter permease YbhS [Candidatus Celerinatantimonas neptuna]